MDNIDSLININKKISDMLSLKKKELRENIKNTNIHSNIYLLYLLLMML